MSALIQSKELIKGNEDLFELPKKDETTLNFLSHKRSLEISKELQSNHKAIKVKETNKKSKISTSSLMKSILISSQKAFEVIKSEERESAQNVHSLTPTSNKVMYNPEEKKECNFPHNNNNKINKFNEQITKESIKKNLTNTFNAIPFKQKSLYDYFKK